MALGGVLLLCVAGWAASRVCLTTWLSLGVSISECPSGTMHQTVKLSALDLRRGQDGRVVVAVTGHYTTDVADSRRTTEVKGYTAALSLLNEAGDETPLEPLKGWKTEDTQRIGIIRLPEVPDGNYILRVKVDSKLGLTTQDLKLPLLAPARVHLITDRPLYEPGNKILFRSVALRASDLHPIGERPGQWEIRDPSGSVVLEERTRADAWGVSSGSFPLDVGAPTGLWTIDWVSGKDRGTTTVTVEPFTLPRFRVEATAEQDWYRPGERPTVRGQVVYSSGAPVANIALSIQWSRTGAWPWPSSWEEGALPVKARTGAGGHFVLGLPEIPGDLVGTSKLQGRITAIDSAGDRVTGLVSLLLSEHGIAVEALTELGDGLVSDFNNRLYLRVTTPKGTPLPRTEITVSRAWGDPMPAKVRTDVDGVAALQLDPGEPVTVKLPLMPKRLPPPDAPIRITATKDLLHGNKLSLADLKALDGWLVPLERCVAMATSNTEKVTMTVRVTPAGVVDRVVEGGSPLINCMAATLRRQRLRAGGHRMMRLEYSINSEHLPKLSLNLDGEPNVPGMVRKRLTSAAARAQLCLPGKTKALSLRRLLLWDVAAGTRNVQTRFAAGSRGKLLPPAVQACIAQRMGGFQLDEPVTRDHFGSGRFSTTASKHVEAPKQQQRTKLGYEFMVQADGPKGEIGRTHLIMNPGTVPTLRIRVEPILAQPGEVVEVSYIRGPSFSGDLPEHLFMRHEGAKPIKSDLDKDTRTASFQLPDDAVGWFSVEDKGVRALVYVRAKSELSVALQPDKVKYAPGDDARIAISTRAGDQPVVASVGLIGVDNSLSQLVELPGPDAMAGMRPQVKTDKPAFGTLDGQALTMGRIQGEYAAAATVLRVTRIPKPEEVDRTVTATSQGTFDPLADLTDHFYTVLSQLYHEALSWQKDAPEGEQITPKVVVQLWKDAVKACEDRGEDVTDAYGRKLRLSWLPSDLLALTDPRLIVSDATRVPEDVIDWRAWVQEEQP